MTCVQVWDRMSGLPVDLRDVKQVICEQQHDQLIQDFYSTKADFEYDAYMVILSLDEVLSPDLDEFEKLDFQIYDAKYLEL